MATLDIDWIVMKLGARYGLNFVSNEENHEGEFIQVIRPADLEKPNGFGLSVTKTQRLVEVVFLPDSYARTLLRQMSDADDGMRANFLTMAQTAVSGEFRISVSVNGNLLPVPSDLPHGEWSKFELECDKKFPSIKLGPDDLNLHAFEVVSVGMGLVLSLLPTENVVESVPVLVPLYEVGLPEGAKIRLEVNRYERNPLNRASCIDHYGTRCKACDFDFGKKYGELGQDYIEVHHRVPVAKMGGEYLVDPVKDLVPVCGNCHAMLHRKDPPVTVEELKKIIAARVAESELNL